MGENLVAVVGATGAGKSSFIKLVTGNNAVTVGHGLTSGKSISNIESFSVAVGIII